LCPSGYEGNDESGECDKTESQFNSTLVYFPFLIVAIILALVAIGGKCKDSKSQIIGNIIVLWSFLEVLMMPVFGFLALLQIKQPIFFALSIVFWLFLVIMNVVYTVWFCKFTISDEHFQLW